MKVLSVNQANIASIFSHARELPVGTTGPRVLNFEEKPDHLMNEVLLIHVKMERAEAEALNWPKELVDAIEVGAIIGSVQTFEIARMENGKVAEVFLGTQKHCNVSWAHTHFVENGEHMTGPYCLLLTGMRRFQTPVVCEAKEGVFEVEYATVKNSMTYSVEVVSKRVGTYVSK